VDWLSGEAILAGFGLSVAFLIISWILIKLRDLTTLHFAGGSFPPVLPVPNWYRILLPEKLKF
jgi:hypothetical protein